jgi:hypothetical protein
MIIILFSALALTVLNLYKVIRKDKLFGPEYELPISFIQSSYYLYYLILLSTFFLGNASINFYTFIYILISILLFVISPFGLSLINYFVNLNLTEVQEGVLVGINLVSILVTTYGSYVFFFRRLKS